MSGLEKVGDKKSLKKFWKWLWKSDSWLSLVVLLIFAYIIIRFIFFPFVSFVTNSPLPLLIVESCSMNHPGAFDFEDWWELRGDWYGERGFTKDQLKGFSFDWGFKMGDIVLLWNRGKIEIGDVIVFQNGESHPIIHRVVSLDPLATKGDYNAVQLNGVGGIDETNIQEKQILGKAVFRIPRVGWFKLIFVKIYEGIKGVRQPPWC